MTVTSAPVAAPNLPPYPGAVGSRHLTSTRRADLAVVVMAKSPVPGQVKTRLCPPLRPDEAASLAAAALLDTMTAVETFAWVRRPQAGSATVRGVLALSGQLTAAPAGPDIAARLISARAPAHRWIRMPQRGNDFAARLVHAHADGHTHAGAVLQIGMDTPQVSPDLLEYCAARLLEPGVDAAVGLANDGGWWALGTNDPSMAELLEGVAMSTAETGQQTLSALRSSGFRVALLPTLTDVDTVDDAVEVARLVPRSRFASVLRSFGIPGPR